MPDTPILSSDFAADGLIGIMAATVLKLALAGALTRQEMMTADL